MLPLSKAPNPLTAPLVPWLGLPIMPDNVCSLVCVCRSRAVIDAQRHMINDCKLYKTLTLLLGYTDASTSTHYIHDIRITV